MAADKLALIDKDLLLRLLGRAKPTPPADPTLRELEHIDEAREEVLSQPIMAAPNKVKTISNLISDHRTHKQKYENQTTRPPIAIRNPTSSEESDEWQQKTLDAAPGRFQRATNSLMNHIRRSGRLDWNVSGQVIKDGQVIEGSNILDLVHAVTRPRKIRPPPGAKIFVNTLNEINTPHELMINAKAMKFTPVSRVLGRRKRVGQKTPLRTPADARKALHTPDTLRPRGRRSEFHTPDTSPGRRSARTGRFATPTISPKMTLPPGWESHS